MFSLKEILVERRIKAIETKIEKLKVIRAPTIIRWNLRKMLRSARQGELNIKDLNKWENEEVVSLENVIGRGGKVHLKVTLVDGQVIGIFSGPYSRFAKVWESKSK